jgi:predicted membrane protein
MGDFGYVVLIIFIIIRILIAAGLLYLIVVEIRRYKKHSTKRDMLDVERSTGEETDEDANGEDTGSSSGSGN